MIPLHHDVGVQRLVHAATDGNVRAVEAALAALEARENGSGMVDRPVPVELPPRAVLDMSTAIPAERALHFAARGGKVEVVRLLLKRTRANPNVIDNRGYNMLLATCAGSHVKAEVARLLLEAGADPTLAETQFGYIPLHIVAYNGHMDLVDMLHSKAPATLNCRTTDGRTPLFAACGQGKDSMVSKLLSLGATQPGPPNESTCPLANAVSQGFVGVVRILINEGGITAVGGELALAKALFRAVRFRRLRILQMLLSADGEKERKAWAYTNVDGTILLHYSAGRCYPAAVSFLLKAGANEAVLDPHGLTPLGVIGMAIGKNDEVQMDQEKEVAVRRMLQRGPAYRARSWAWPSDGNTTAAAGAAAGGAVLSSPPAVNAVSVTGLRIFRPKEKSSGIFFGRLIGRYCAKD